MTQGKKLFVRDATGLVRELSTTDTFVWTIVNVPLLLSYVNMVFWVTSSGLLNVDYVITTLIWMVGGGIVIMLYYAMAGAMPRAGGDYAWGTRALHPAIGFVMSWSFVWINILSEATGSYGGVAYLSSGLSIAGKMSSDPGLQAFAATLTQQNSELAIGIAILLFAALAGSFGKKLLKTVIYFIFFVGLIGLLVAFGLLISATREAYIASFNGISGLPYEQVMAEARTAGYMPIATIAASLSAVPYAVLTLGPHNVASFLGGEVKSPKRSFLYGMVGAWAFSAVVWLLAFALLDSTIGMRFIEAMTFLSTSKPDVYAQTGMPAATANLFMSVITKNPLIVHLVTFGVFVGNMGWMIILFPVNARIFFAWAFDRVAPLKFAEVSDRYGTPVYSVLLMAIASIGAFIVIYFYPALFTFNIALLLSVWYGLSGVTAIALPYRRKDIFENSPLKMRIGGVPVLSILGVAALLIYIYIAYAALNNPSLGPISASALSWTAILVLAALVLFYAIRALRKSQGIDFDAIFREIPPE